MKQEISAVANGPTMPTVCLRFAYFAMLAQLFSHEYGDALAQGARASPK